VKRVVVGCAVAATVLGSIVASGCLGRSSRPAAPRPVQETAPLAGAPDASRVEEKSIDLFEAKPILDDERLSSVKAVAADPARAAQVLADLVDAAPPADDDLDRWRYQLGRLRTAAGDFAGGARAFDLVAAGEGPLKAYADFASAQALGKISQFEEAIVRASRIPADLPISIPARLLVADAYESLRKYDKAMAIWQDHLASGRHPARWIEIALRMGEAILANGPDADRAVQASNLARRVIVEAPTSSSVDRAIDLHRRAFALLPKDKRRQPIVAHGKKGALLPRDFAAALSPEDQLARASALSDAFGYKDAEAALDAMPAALPADIACKALVLRAQVQNKLKDRTRAADTFGAAIPKCEAYPEVLPDALLGGGRASVSSNQCDEAVRRFERLEKDFHAHRYADDARLRRAECALTMNDEQRYADLLASMPDDYPDGDMVGDGLFRLALRKMTKGEWASALPVLTRALDFKSDDGGSARGRAAYFRARALVATGDVAAGKDALARIVADQPLSYYMLHAYARLFEIDEARARAALDQATVREPAGHLLSSDEPVFGSADFSRVIELVRQGENDFARREMGRLSQDGAAPDALWAAAFLHARAGAFTASHAIPRSRVSDWLEHYPVGRWREAWELAFPRPYQSAVDRETKRSGIPAALAYAIMREESAFDPEAVSPSRAHGLMQLILPTARAVAKAMRMTCDEASLHEPETNIALGCRFLADLRARFPSNPHIAIPSYNAGPAASQRWIASRTGDDFDLWVEQIPYDETRRYTKRVLTSYAAYLFLYEKDALDSALKLPKVVHR